MKYRDRLEKDLDGWIAAGLVPESSRGPILAGVDRNQPNPAPIWLGVVGAALAGLAIIAWIGDNWAAIPRLGKLGLLLSLFWAAVGAAVYFSNGRRPNTVNALLLIAALIFAASVGLLGQAYNMVGTEAGALLISAIGAGALALAGRSPAAGAAMIVLASFWFTAAYSESGGEHGLTYAHLGGFAFLGFGIGLSRFLGSRVLFHMALAMAGLLIFAFFGSLFEGALGEADRVGDTVFQAGIATFALFGLLAAFAMLRLKKAAPGAATLLGWSVWHALAYFALAGVDVPGGDQGEIVHRIGWLLLSIGVISLGGSLRRGWVTAAGIVNLAISAFVLLVDLGVSLGTASALFGLCAAIALIAAFMLRDRKTKEAAQ